MKQYELQAEKLVAQLQRVCCSLSAKTQAVDNFLGVAVSKASKIQTKFTLKVVPETTKIAYI